MSLLPFAIFAILVLFVIVRALRGMSISGPARRSGSYLPPRYPSQSSLDDPSPNTLFDSNDSNRSLIAPLIAGQILEETMHRHSSPPEYPHSHDSYPSQQPLPQDLPPVEFDSRAAESMPVEIDNRSEPGWFFDTPASGSSDSGGSSSSFDSSSNDSSSSWDSGSSSDSSSSDSGSSSSDSGSSSSDSGSSSSSD